MTVSAGLHDELLAIAAAVPGVTAVYGASPTPTALLETAAALVDRQRDPGAITIAEDRAGLTIALTIGVSEDSSAAATCRAVYESLVAYLTGSAHRPAARIRVLVASVG